MMTLNPNIQVRQRKGNKPILISICIPTYNRSRYLGQLLDVIYEQSVDFVEEIEVVISNNASTDDTPSVIDAFTERYPNFVVNRWGENTGTRYNVCNIPKFASGKYVWFLCDDDMLEDSVLIEVFDFIKANDELALISLNWINFNQRDPVYQDFENRIYPSAEDIFMKCGEYMALGSAVIVSRSLYSENLKDGDEHLWFPHFIVSMRGAASRPCGHLGKPVLKRHLVDKPTWHVKAPYIWLIDYPRSVLSLASYGYRIERLQTCLEAVWQTTFLKRMIRFKKSSDFTKSGVTLLELWRINSFRNGFYFRILPLSLVPSSVYRNAVRLANFIKRKSHGSMDV